MGMPGLCALLIGTLIGAAAGADPSKPHPHQGKLEAFQHGPSQLLSSSEMASVDAGNPIQKTVQFTEGLGARAVAAFHVDAPPEVVWECINDIRQYPRMVPGVADTKVYTTSKTRSGGTLTYVTYTLAMLGYRLTYFLELSYEPKHNSMIFRLDYSRFSDLEDTIGYWHVVPTSRGSRITYSAALLLRGWWPKSVVNFLLSTSLGRATSWVGVEAAARLTASSGGGKQECKWSWRALRKVCKEPPAPPPVPPPPSISAGFAVTMAALAFAVFGAHSLRRKLKTV